MPVSLGRKKGVPNKNTTLLKEATIMAARVAGEKMPGGKDDPLVAFLAAQAVRKNNAPFMNLLGKVLPLQITGENGGAIEMVKRIVIETQPADNAE